MKAASPYLSIVIPVFNEADNLVWHYKQIQAYFTQKDLSYECIYVDDGSRDDSLAIIKDLAHTDDRVRFISFSRNFGKEAATTAGLRKAQGQGVLLLDADGQYPLETVDEFLKAWKEGADMVIGVRGKNPSETLVQKFGSRSFYRLLRWLDSNQEVVSRSTDFRLLDRRVVTEFNALTERNRVTRNLLDWLGFKRVYVPFHALERHGGIAAYSFSKRLKLALDGLVKHSTKPLKFIAGVGALISVVSVIAAVLLVIEKYAMNDPLNLAISGSAILALFLSFMIGVVLFCQGLLALYLENVYHETQNRPLYIVREEQ